jgi:hypothetical protein
MEQTMLKFPFEANPQMILATRGKVFTLKTLDRMVDCTRLKEFHTQKL